ncbi:MAG: RagB/SusD family nutrient uptake outer membrane protein [Dysgonamonadaceae bacterium]
MKKTLFYTSILICILFSACSDSFLTVDHTTELEGEKAYTPERIESAMIAAYQPLQWMDMWMPLPFISEVMGNDIRVGGGNLSDQAGIHDLSRYQAKAVNHPDAVWNSAYSGIFRTNIVLNEVDKVNISEDAKETLRAEAYSLRTFYYFLVWRFYGNIPYFSNNPTDIVTEWTNIKQYSVNDAYAALINDIDTALKSGKLAKSSAEGQYGRFTQAAAQMLKAQLVLTQKDETKYEEVLNDMQTIIASPNYALMSNFADIWEDAGEWCSESIFEINYTDQNATRGWGSSAFNPGGSVFQSMIGINGLSDINFNGGWGFMPMEPNLYNAFEDADTRKNASILNFKYYKEHVNPAAVYDTTRWDDTGCFNKKYLPRKGGNSHATSSPEVNYRNNIRVFRLADTYLIAAELLVRRGQNQALADEYLNEVRGRAYKYTGSYQKTATLDNILAERRLEFAGEGYRFFDMIRFGKESEITHKMQTGWSDSGNGKKVRIYGTFTYDPSKRYFPIPQSEVDRSLGALKQNTGY